MYAYHKDTDFCAGCELELQSLSLRCKSMKTGVIVTSDGFVVSTYGDLDDSGNRLGSMTSSMQALAEAVHHELGLSENKHVTFASDNGNIVMCKMGKFPLVMTVMFDHRETLGQALYSMNSAVETICEQIGR